jgi:hemerythrin-like domain-containing protein
MKRDARLRPLSRDHYQGLVLARFIATICARDGMDAAAVAVVRERFLAEIAPHFVAEETLLSLLEGHGVDHLVARTRAEHETMMRLLDDATAGTTSAAHDLGVLLAQHIRFEEHELFPACETLLSDDELARIEAAHSHEHP